MATGRLFFCTVVLLWSGWAAGQDFSNKAIRIVTSAAGGGNDIQTRFLAPVISASLGTPVIVDNRANSMMASEYISKAPPDGLTMMYAGQTLWQSPLLQKMPYDIAEFAPVSLVAREIYIVAVNTSLPAKSIKELIALAKAQPGHLNYGSGPAGSPGHLGMELFKSLSGTNLVFVPYKGTQPAMMATVSGEVQVMIANPGLVLPQSQAGKVRALAITGATHSELLPNLPTIAESGLPGYEMTLMNGMFASAKTPRPLINRLNEEIVRALNQPDVKQKFLTTGVEAASSTPEQFDAAIKADTSRMARVIKEANIKID